MNIIKKFTLKSMKQNFRWTLVTAIGIVISVAMMSGLATISSSFLSFLIEGEKDFSGNWHVQVESDQPSTIEKLQSIEHVDDLSIMKAVGFVSVAERENTPYIKILSMDKQAMLDFKANLVVGRLPIKSSEIVLSQEDAEGIALNDTVSFSVGYRYFEEELIDDNASFRYEWYEGNTKNNIETKTIEEYLGDEQTIDYTVVGIMDKSSLALVYHPYTLAISGYTSTMVSPYDYRMSLKVSPLRRSNLKQVMADVGQLEGVSYTQNSGLLRYYGIISNDTFYGVLLGMLAIIVSIIMVASIALIYNAFSIALSQRTRQLGMLASVGATKKQKRKNVFLEAFYISLIAIPLGLLSGVVGIGITLKFIEPLLADFMLGAASLKLVVWWQALGIAALISSITIFISVWIPARRASSMSVIDALSERKEIKISKRAVKTPKWIRKVFGIEGDLALKNLRRNKRKFRATVISLTLSMVLFISVSYFMTSMFSLAKTQLNSVNFDVEILINTSTIQEKDTIIESILVSEYIDEYSIQTRLSSFINIESAPLTPSAKQHTEEAQLRDLYITIVVLNQNSFEEYISDMDIDASDFTRGSYNFIALNSVNDDSVYESRFIGKALIEEEVTIVSDVFQMESNIDAKDVELNIISFTEKELLGITNSTFYNYVLITNEASLDDLMSQFSDSSINTNKVIYTRLFFKSSDDVALESQIEKVMDEHSDTRYLINNMKTEFRSIANIKRVMEIFIYGFIILISIISVANIINTITTNVQIRKKEFAMLRSIGMTPKSFNTMIRFESLFYGLNAIALGIPISLGIIALINYVLSSGFIIQNNFPFGSFVFVFVVVFAIVLITMLFAVSHIRKDNIVDTLKMDN